MDNNNNNNNNSEHEHVQNQSSCSTIRKEYVADNFQMIFSELSDLIKEEQEFRAAWSSRKTNVTDCDDRAMCLLSTFMVSDTALSAITEQVLIVYLKQAAENGMVRTCGILLDLILKKHNNELKEIMHEEGALTTEMIITCLFFPATLTFTTTNPIAFSLLKKVLVGLWELVLSSTTESYIPILQRYRNQTFISCVKANQTTSAYLLIYSGGVEVGKILPYLQEKDMSVAKFILRIAHELPSSMNNLNILQTFKNCMSDGNLLLAQYLVRKKYISASIIRRCFTRGDYNTLNIQMVLFLLVVGWPISNNYAHPDSLLRKLLKDRFIYPVALMDELAKLCLLYDIRRDCENVIDAGLLDEKIEKRLQQCQDDLCLVPIVSFLKSMNER